MRHSNGESFDATIDCIVVVAVLCYEVVGAGVGYGEGGAGKRSNPYADPSLARLLCKRFDR